MIDSGAGPAVIGVHDGHNAAVAFVRDGRVELALQEERITRIKNQGDAPQNALALALERAKGSGGISRVALNGRYMRYGQWQRETILGDYGRCSRLPSRIKQSLKDTFVDRFYQRRKAYIREQRYRELGIEAGRLEAVLIPGYHPSDAALGRAFASATQPVFEDHPRSAAVGAA